MTAKSYGEVGLKSIWRIGWLSLTNNGLVKPRQYRCSSVVCDGNVGFLTVATPGRTEDMSMR